nr:hypothetical protein [Tanacetum cinerariifolium]
MDSIEKYMLEIILHRQRTPQLFKQKKLMQTQEDHSNLIPALNVDSLKVDLVVIQNTCSEKEDNNSKTASNKSIKEKDLKGTRIEHRFKRAFMSLFVQDVDTFTTFWVVNNQFQKFIDSQFTLDYDSQMTDKYFVEYTRIEYDRRVNKRQLQMQESKIDTGKAVDADLVVTESSRTKSKVQDNSSRSGNDTDADDADIRPIYDEEPMAKVQLTAECNILAIGKQHTEQPEIINEGRVDQYPEQCQVKSPMLDSSSDNQKTEYLIQSYESENILLKKTVAQFQKDFSRIEAHCISLELQNQNQALKSGQHGQIFNETSNKAKIKKEIDVLETMNIELEHSVAKLRYVDESDPEEDPEEYEEDETEDGPVGYPMDKGDDEDDDDIDSSGYDADNKDEDKEEEEEYLAPADSATVIPIDELASPPKGTESIIPPPSARTRIIIRPQTSISLPPEAEVERILAMPTPSPSPLTSLSPPSAGERLARCTAPATLPSPPLPPSSYPPPHVDRRDGESSMRGRGVDYGFADTVEAEMRHRGIGEVGYGIKDTWIDPAEAVPEMAPTTLEKVNTRVTELAELHEHDTQDLYALLEDAQDGRTRISQRVAMDSQRVDLLMGDRMTLQETVWIMEEEAYAVREAWAHSVGLSQTVHHELQTLREKVNKTWTESTPPNTNTPPHHMTPESVHAMINQALLRNSTNGDGSQSSHEDNTRHVQTTRPCFYANFIKCHPLNFKGNEGVVDAALTWWNSQIRTLGPEAYAMTWEVLKKKITDKYCPQGELKKLEIELWNPKVKENDIPTYTNRFQELTLICTKFVANENEKIDKYISGLLDNIYGNVKSSKPRTLDETIELTNDLMDQKLRTYAEKADNKRKTDDTSRNNHGHQQQPFK